jgi:transglutaminase-like putative cysteine protease
MEYQLIHQTVYHYSEPVTVSQHAARLEPIQDARQTTRDFSLRVQPQPDVVNTRTDYFGNRTTVFGIREFHKELVVESASRVTVRPFTPPAAGLSPAWREVAALFRDPVSPQNTGP